MKIRKSDLDKIAVMPEQYPNDPLPEIAFAGRSNVGKSSFINSIINRKGLARTSGKPGKTRTINFYKINDNFRLVDLPGYGYAKVSKAEKEKWGHIIEEYLETRENIREVVLIVDIRHKPSKDDIMMCDWLKHFGFGSLVIATKADKLKRNQQNKNIKVIEKELNLDPDDKVMAYSATNKMNLREVWDELKDILQVK